ncbi:ABC transporter ATP-binding protein [Sodaliphilus sp.]|uniref:ABC transporter ATP-binding protein n=1 Tax=Sodaliphilus sp. TaxID=2815818 RepID=UPI003890B7E3
MTVLEFENISKQYQLGKIGTGTLSRDLNRWWASVRGKEDPYLKIGQRNDRASKAQGDFVWALRDINLKVEQGEVLGIIGKNGSGKSTLLKILSRVTSPTTGRIRGRGRVASLLEVGTGFHPEMTGRENIYMNGSIMGMTRAEIDRKLDEIIDFAGVQMYVDTPVKRYSSGMKVRLGFAVAAHLEPEILVVDEVLAVGDAEFQKKAIGKMQDVSRGQGRTVLFVSHNMAAVGHLCTSGIVLNNGTLAFAGTAHEAIQHYSLQHTAPAASSTLTPDPRSEGQLKDISMQFLDENGDEITPRCGSPLTVRIKCHALNDYRSVKVAFVIRDPFERPILACPSYLTHDEFAMLRGNHCFELKIPKLPVTAGNYMAGLFIEVGKDTLYGQRDAMRFEVEDADFFGNGRTLPAHIMGSALLCEHEWDITTT